MIHPKIFKYNNSYSQTQGNFLGKEENNLNSPNIIFHNTRQTQGWMPLVKKNYKMKDDWISQVKS